MPMSRAAAACVSFRCRMVRSIRTTSPALIRCSPASARPRSANTLPVLGSCLRASLFGILHLSSQLFEPLPDQFHHLHHLAANTMQGFGLDTPFAQLRSVHRIADVVLNASRK